jgi:hypothetical protein
MKGYKWISRWINISKRSGYIEMIKGWINSRDKYQDI